jgi:hypothetical protein
MDQPGVDVTPRPSTPEGIGAARGPRGQVLADLDSELRELSSLVEELVALAVNRRDDERSRRWRSTSSPSARLTGRGAAAGGPVGFRNRAACAEQRESGSGQSADGPILPLPHGTPTPAWLRR